MHENAPRNYKRTHVPKYRQMYKHQHTLIQVNILCTLHIILTCAYVCTGMFIMCISKPVLVKVGHAFRSDNLKIATKSNKNKSKTKLCNSTHPYRRSSYACSVAEKSCTRFFHTYIHDCT